MLDKWIAQAASIAYCSCQLLEISFEIFLQSNINISFQVVYGTITYLICSESKYTKIQIEIRKNTIY